MISIDSYHSKDRTFLGSFGRVGFSANQTDNLGNKYTTPLR
jgi:hypothetical protein